MVKRKEHTTREIEQSKNTNVFITGVLVTFLTCCLFGMFFNDKINSLEEEIELMPGYECWDKNVDIFINKTSVSRHCTIDNHHGSGNLSDWDCTYSYGGNEAKCTENSNVCYVKLNGCDAILGAAE